MRHIRRELTIELLDQDNVNETGYFRIVTPTGLSQWEEETYKELFENVPNMIQALQHSTGCQSCGADNGEAQSLLRILAVDFRY